MCVCVCVMQGITWLAEDLSQEGLCCMELLIACFSCVCLEKLMKPSKIINTVAMIGEYKCMFLNTL